MFTLEKGQCFGIDDTTRRKCCRYKNKNNLQELLKRINMFSIEKLVNENN